ncbi:TetR/AcrR family transcriptional regulator [Paenibacillus lautus]|uniref:TetR/AcrR family transcriptional regulator n=1 Tax=Paenibacillus lautus TaxID=1401 RepID=UPI002DBD1BFF|nr:TetR/AcrR family transcriptional regulator [Paenibacillus lautus]MEC0305908.1 TetR/AcrR family transcriptional regulator [Paenibacillus lautus]
MSKREQKFEARQELILQTAERLITDNGYHAIKMSDIADALEIAKGTLYLHYKSKEELVFELIKPKIMEFRQIVESTVSEDFHPVQQVERIIDEALSSSFFTFVLTSFPDMGAIFADAKAKELQRVQDEVIDCLERIIERGKKERVFTEDLPTHFSALQLMQLLDPLVYSILVREDSMSHADFVKYTTLHYLNSIRA